MTAVAAESRGLLRGGTQGGQGWEMGTKGTDTLWGGQQVVVDGNVEEGSWLGRSHAANEARG